MTARPAVPASRSGRKVLSLALQGGGAHGAFTWGVLDRLLDEPQLDIAAISGTSAGAMNAAALAGGWVEGEREGARLALRRFWSAVGELGQLTAVTRTPIDLFMNNWNLDQRPGYLWLEWWSRVTSPYDFNPLSLNPLQDLLERSVDFALVRACTAFELFVSATNVETGRVQVFSRAGLTAEKVMASAALPMLYQAVEIDGVPYWDGGYMGNPALFPLFDVPATADILIVQINPTERPGVPTGAREILNRLNEITFNGSLLRELRAIDFVARLLQEGRIDPGRYRAPLIHLLANPETFAELNASSKLNAERAFLDWLFTQGQACADRWLASHWSAINQHSSINLRRLFEGTIE